MTRDANKAPSTPGAGGSLEWPSPCNDCAQKPCVACFGSGSVIGGLRVLSWGERIPFNCPARLDTRDTARIQNALRWMSPLDRESLARSLRVKRFSDSTDLESDILRALRAPAVRILLPTTGSIPSRLGSQAAGEKLRGAAAAKSAEKREDGDASPASEEPKPRLQNPEWVWIEDPKRPGCEERRLGESALLDVLFCKVDTADLMPGDTVTFKIALKSGSHEPETWVDTVTGRVGAGRNDEAAVGRFVLPPEVAGRKVIPKKDIFIFEAKVFSHQLSLKGPELKVVPKQPIFVMSY